MKATQLLDALRNIRKEIVAFISIVIIGLLAAMAFLGIAYSAATLKKDALRFFNENSLWDLEVTSTMLMTDDDLEAILSLPGVREAEPVWQIDAKLYHDGNTAVTVTSLPEAVSLPVLREGRLPVNPQECAIEKNLADDLALTVGQSLRLECNRIMETDPLVESSFVITGIFHTPDHFSYMVPVTPYVLVTKECFNREGLDGAFMKARVRVEDTPENRYGDDYWNVIKPVAAALEELAGTRTSMRTEALLKDFDEQIRAGEEQIKAAREQQLQAQQKMEEGRQELEKAREQLDSIKKQIDAAEPLIKAGREKIDDAHEALENENSDSSLFEQYSRDELRKMLRKAEEAYETLRNNWYYSGEEYLDGLTRYEKGLKQLEDGERELAEGEAKLRDAEKELEKARSDRDAFGVCRWILLNNNSNPGFIYAAANADKLSSLSMSFSTIFLVVGVLVIYATISRMVEQQRRQIGVNKAMGLFNREIFAKYLVFACGAVLLGVGLGVLLSWLPMQRAVLKSYEAHLNYGTGTRSFLLCETGLVAAGAFGISVLAVYMGCSKLLRLSALALMQGTNSVSSRRKKSRSSARRSLYLRLIFRNMQTDWARVLVTIVSIAGGCVLMVVGFTLRFGISGVPDRQFGGIMTYEAEIFFSDSENPAAGSEIETLLDRNDLQHVAVRKESAVFEINETMNALTLITAETGSLRGFYSLRSVDDSNELDLPESGALVPRRFWESYGIDVGESVSVYDTELNPRHLEVSGVFENYYGQLFFLTPQGYEEVFGAIPENNCFLVRTEGVSLNRLQELLAGVVGLVSVNDAAAERAMIEQFSSSLNFVVYFMLFLAGMMACFIVANFTVTFIQRKTGELTIMRINGFTSGECVRYVAVDLIVTTVLGTAVGLAAGGFMGAHILSVTEAPYIQMIREPRAESFLYAALITFVFSAITNSLALRRIRRLKLTDLA